MQEGVVKWFSRSYGFIESQGEDFFIHISDVLSPEPLEKGDKVEFEPEETDRGKKATKVKIKSKE